MLSEWTRQHVLIFPPAYNWQTQGPRVLLPQAAVSVYYRHPVTPGCETMESSAAAYSVRLTVHCRWGWLSRFSFFVPGDLDLWLPNSNSCEIFVQYTELPSFIVLCLIVWKLSCWQTDKLTNKQMPLKTSTSLRYATPVGNQGIGMSKWRGEFQIVNGAIWNVCLCVYLYSNFWTKCRFVCWFTLMLSRSDSKIESWVKVHSHKMKQKLKDDCCDGQLWRS